MLFKPRLSNPERASDQSRSIAGKYAYYIPKAPDQREIYSTFHNHGVNRIAGIAMHGRMPTVASHLKVESPARFSFPGVLYRQNSRYILFSWQNQAESQLRLNIGFAGERRIPCNEDLLEHLVAYH